MSDEFFSFAGVKHLSVSTVNSFISYKSNFIENKMKGQPFRPSANMARGTAVEHGLNTYIKGAGIETAVLEAQTNFKNSLVKDKFNQQKADDLYPSIEGCVLEACRHYKSFLKNGAPQMQERFEVQLDGIKRPIVGYLDYLFDECIRDLKCVSKTPSYGLSQGYKIQGAVYKKVYGVDVYFDHIVANKEPKAVPVKLTDQDYSFGLNYFVKAAQALERMLDACENGDPYTVLEQFAFPDLSQVWDADEKEAIAKQYGL